MSRRFRRIPAGIARFLAAVALLPTVLHAQVRWTLEEYLRIGTMDEGPASFADVRGVAVGANGTIWVLDFKTQGIRMFDGQGKFVKRVARVGSGPGEIRNANGMVIAPNGDIWVNDPGNGRFTVYTPAGDYSAQYLVHEWGYGYVWSAMFDRQGRLNEQFPLFKPGGTNSMNVRRIAGDGVVMDTIPEPGCRTEGVDPERAFYEARSKTASMSMGVPFLPRPVMAWDPTGAVWCSGGDHYEVLRIALVSGDTTTRIIRDVKPLPVTRAEHDREVARIHDSFSTRGFDDPDFGWIPKTKPVVTALDVDDAGRVWVRGSQADESHTTFDVWNDAGQLVATAVAPFRINPYWHPLFRGDTVYAVTTDADDVPYVVRAVIRRPSQP